MIETPEASRTRRRVLFLTGWYVHPLHEGIVDYAKEAGWVLDNDMCYSGRIPTIWEGNGILCRHAFRQDMIDFAAGMGLPVVGFEADERLDTPCVYYDGEAIGRLAAEHLLERGYRRLGFFHLGLTPFQRRRMEGFRGAAEAAGAGFLELAPSERVRWPLPSDYSWDWLQEGMEALLPSAGIMASNDAIARPLLNALEQFGVSVPEQVAVVGAENDELLCEMSRVPLSSVDANTRELGYQAAALLDRMMDGEPAPSQTLRISPVGVVARSSTNMLAAENPHAARALRFIWDRYREPISVEDVAHGLPVSRRRLQTLFREDFGRTIQAEISRVRVEAACRYLGEAELKVREVAARTGFSSSLHMHRAFLNRFGIGPKAFAEAGRPPGLPRIPGPVKTTAKT